MSWLFTDAITSNQNAKEKTYNYALLFNDSSEKDEVSGKAIFYINNEKHQLEKSLTRSWKKNKKDITHPQWWTLLSGAPTVDMILTINKLDGTIQELKNDEVKEYLTNILGSFKDFETSTFTDGVKLRELINRDSTYIIQQVLDAMGLTIIDNLLASYNSIKDEKLNKLTKPEYTSVEYTSMIEFETTYQKDVKERQKSYKLEIQNTENLQKQKNDEILSIEAKKHQVKSEEDLLKEKSELIESNKLLQIDIDKNNEAIAEAEKASNENYDDKIDEKNAELVKQREVVSNQRSEIQTKQLQIAEKQSKQKDLLTAESTAWHESTKTISTTISENKIKLSTLTSCKKFTC
jgi:hypothetical protein